jgi:uncharacterized membrane protein
VGSSKSRVSFWLGIVLPTLLIALFLLAPPWSILGKADLFGYAVCHQLPEHSFQPGGVPLPLCARCSGTFLAALLGFAALWIAGRGRASGLPPARVLLALVLFICVWGVDGLNSFASFWPNVPQLYQPSNLLRLITGALAGTAVSLLLQLVLNMLLWRQPDQRASIASLRELGLLLIPAAGLIAIVSTEWSFTLYPLAILEALGVWVTLSGINVALLIIISRRENSMDRWTQALPFLLWGAAFALAEVGVIDLLRGWLTSLLPVTLTLLSQMRIA